MATFSKGLINTTTGLIRNPIVYSPNPSDTTTREPFSTATANNQPYIPVSGNITLSGTFEGLFTKNLDTPLVIFRDNSYQGEWLNVRNDTSGALHTIVTFKNGNTIKAKYQSSILYIFLYTSDNQIYAEHRFSGPSSMSNYYMILSVFHDDTTQKDFINFYSFCKASSFCLYNRGFNISNARINTYFLSDTVLPDDPYATYPDSEGGGGYGDFDYSGDSVLPPDLPTISVANTGFVSLYAPTLTQLQSLAQYMWSGLFDLATFRKLFADPMDCIISLNILPVNLPQGTAQELKVGNIGTGQNINTLSAQFIKVSFKTKSIGVRTNSFMDYSPYVKAQLFLPFIGTRSISIDDIANATMSIEYHIDLFSGACTAYVTITKSNSDNSTLNSSLYQFNGNICANIPFTATNYNSFLSSLLGTAAAVTTAIATQGSSSAVAGALSSGIDTATAIKPDVERSGNMSATNGFLGIQKPFLIVTYPHVCKPSCRDKTVGTPSFIGLSNIKRLSSFHGFTRLHKINVKGIPCTEEERQMIETLLTGEGVILP